MRFPKLSLLIALALTAFLASSALAVGFSAGVGAGIQSYTGDAGKGWNSGLLIGGWGDYALNSSWAVGADVSYAMSKHDDDGTQGAFGTISDELKLTQFGGHAKYFFPLPASPVHPYLLAGAGIYSVKVDWSDGPVSESSSDSKFGFRGGVGATYSMNPLFGLAAEADYHVVQTEGESLTFFGIKGGLSFHFASK